MVWNKMRKPSQNKDPKELIFQNHNQKYLDPEKLWGQNFSILRYLILLISLCLYICPQNVHNNMCMCGKNKKEIHKKRIFISIFILSLLKFFENMF